MRTHAKKVVLSVLPISDRRAALTNTLESMVSKRTLPPYLLEFNDCRSSFLLLSRTGTAAGLAQQYALAIGQLPNTVLVALDEGLARQAAAFGAQYKLRGAGSVFLASAALFAAELVILDREQLQRGSSIVQTLSPGNFLKTADSA